MAGIAILATRTVYLKVSKREQRYTKEIAFFKTVFKED